MRETINKAKFIGKTIVRKFIAMSLVMSMGFYGASLRTNAQSDNSTSDSSSSTFSQPPQDEDLSPNNSDDDFSCCFDIFCFFPLVIFTLLKVIYMGHQSLCQTSSRDK